MAPGTWGGSRPAEWLTGRTRRHAAGLRHVWLDSAIETPPAEYSLAMLDARRSTGCASARGMAFVRSARVPVASGKNSFVFDLPAELLTKPGGQKNCVGFGPTPSRWTCRPAEKLNRRLDSVWFGASCQLKQAAYYGALGLARAQEPSH